MRRMLIAAVLLLLTAPARAEPAAAPPSDAPGAALLPPELRGPLQDLHGAMMRLLDAIPRYQMPRVLDNGDILIPRAPARNPAGVPPADKDATRRAIAT